MVAEQTNPSARISIRSRARVIANQTDAGGQKLVLEVPGWPGSTPGQFLMLGAGAETGVPRIDPLLPRPMAVYRDLGRAVGAADAASPRIEILYRVVGRGTRLLSQAQPGQSISLIGPLGHGFPIEPSAAPALLVGGGTGIASLYELAKAIASLGRTVSVLLGARSEPDFIGVRDFESLDVELECTTEDGSRGRQGLVTEPLAERLEASAPGTTVFACGPTPMMRAAAELAETKGAACFVSLDNPLACGFGVCLGCAAPRREGGFSLVCREGPVFEAGEIDWEGLP